jgi:hypothetical protein
MNMGPMICSSNCPEKCRILLKPLQKYTDKKTPTNIKIEETEAQTTAFLVSLLRQ